MSEVRPTIAALRAWLKTCPLIAEEQEATGAAFRIAGRWWQSFCAITQSVSCSKKPLFCTVSTSASPYSRRDKKR